jgi:putative membrane protein
MMLMLTAWLSNKLALNFQVSGCWTAVFGALVVSIVSALLSMFLADAD